MPKARILIADDDRVILSTLAEGLEHAGYEVFRAANGKEAVKHCLENRPDLAILDIRMPEMSGIEAARVCRMEVGVPFLFLTAYGDAEIVTQAVAEGALGYLLKPVDTKQIVPAIEAALARAKEFREITEAKEHLGLALETRRETDVAVGLLMERLRLTAEQAFEVLRRLARSRSRKVSEIAAEMLAASDVLNRPTSEAVQPPPASGASDTL